MIKYYQGVLNKSESEMGKLKTGVDAAPKLGPFKFAVLKDGAKTSATSYWDKNWMNPKLDAKYGYHPKNGDNGPQTWTTEFAGDGSKKYEVKQLIYMKRGDTLQYGQYLTAVKVEYYDGKQWKSYKNGEWLKTGVKSSDPVTKMHYIDIDPPIKGATKVRLQLDKAHAKNHISGRFDWVAAEEL